MDKRVFICYRVVRISLDEDQLNIFLFILLLIQNPTKSTSSIKRSFSHPKIFAASSPVIRHCNYIKCYRCRDSGVLCPANESMWRNAERGKSRKCCSVGEEKSGCVQEASSVPTEVLWPGPPISNCSFLWPVCRWRRVPATCSLACSESHLLLPFM